MNKNKRTYIYNVYECICIYITHKTRVLFNYSVVTPNQGPFSIKPPHLPSSSTNASPPPPPPPPPSLYSLVQSLYTFVCMMLVCPSCPGLFFSPSLPLPISILTNWQYKVQVCIRTYVYLKFFPLEPSCVPGYNAAAVVVVIAPDKNYKNLKKIVQMCINIEIFPLIPCRRKRKKDEENFVENESERKKKIKKGTRERRLKLFVVVISDGEG